MGLEPTTCAATKQCSTIELQTPKGERRVELRTSSLQNYCSTIELFTQIYQNTIQAKILYVPNWTRTNNLAINSRSLYHWATETYKKKNATHVSRRAGFEPTPKILETFVLPLNYPLDNINATQHIILPAVGLEPTLLKRNRFWVYRVYHSAKRALKNRSATDQNEQPNSRATLFSRCIHQEEWDSNPRCTTANALAKHRFKPLSHPPSFFSTVAKITKSKSAKKLHNLN